MDGPSIKLRNAQWVIPAQIFASYCLADRGRFRPMRIRRTNSRCTARDRARASGLLDTGNRAGKKRCRASRRKDWRAEKTQEGWGVMATSDSICYDRCGFPLWTCRAMPGGNDRLTDRRRKRRLTPRGCLSRTGGGPGRFANVSSKGRRASSSIRTHIGVSMMQYFRDFRDQRLRGPSVLRPFTLNIQINRLLTKRRGYRYERLRLKPSPVSFSAIPECQIFVMWLILSPANCIT